MKWHNNLFGAALAAVGLLGGASVVGVSVASVQPADSPLTAPGDRGGRADRRGGGMERLLADLD